MPTQPEPSDEQSRRLVYLAAERTLSSWIRTALSLMVLGFVVDRFYLVLRQAFGGKSVAGLQARTLWHLGGSILIALGALMAVVAGIYYLRFALRYRRNGSTEVGGSLVVAALFTFVLGAFGVALLAVLAWVAK